jgi:hypothetical protein
LDQIGFNILEVKSSSEKHRIVWAIMNTNNFIEEYKIPKERLVDFLNTMEFFYNQKGNPFHNYDHGVQVM